jgi:hypothetical protein
MYRSTVRQLPVITGHFGRYRLIVTLGRNFQTLTIKKKKIIKLRSYRSPIIRNYRIE